MIASVRLRGAGPSVAVAAGAGAAAITCGLAAVTLPSRLFFMWFAAAGALIAAYKIIAPRRRRPSPGRLYPPALAAYTLLSLAIEQPVHWRTQLALLGLFVGGFVAGSLIVPASGRRAAAVPRSQPLLVSSRALLAFEALGLMVYAFVYFRVGVPILAPDPAETRVALAAPGLAGLYVSGRVLVEIVLILDLMSLTGYVRTDRPRQTGLHIAFIGLLMVSSTSRSDVVIPVAITLIALLLMGWRDRRVVLMGLACLVAFFLVEGLYRGVPTRSWLAPAKNYLVSTAQTNDRIVRTYPVERPHTHGRQFFWFGRRLLGRRATPPGIYLKNSFSRAGTFKGFGLETNVLGGLYLDWGRRGVLLGGLLIGLLAQGMFLYWQRRRGWSTLACAFTTVWLALSVAIHPIANYWFLLFPVGLFVWVHTNRLLLASERTRLASRVLAAR